MLTVIFALFACAPTPESFGARYEAAFCDALEVCGPDEFGEDYDEVMSTSCAAGYLAGTWTEERCPEWSMTAEQAEACIASLEGTCFQETTECKRDQFGCD